MFDPRAGAPKRWASQSQDFQAVILVGYGENLYPFNQGTNVISKALLPVGNVPIINYVIDWVLAAGLLDILIIVPNTFHDQIADHIAEAYNKSTHSRVQINLRKNSEGERDEDEGDSEEKDGTARILKKFRNFIKSDFVLLPCDISPPSYLPLKTILDKHRSSPKAVMTSVFYEPIESVKDAEEKILVGLDKTSDELLLITPLEGMEEDLELRMSLLNRHPTLSLTTRILDAHVYVFRRTFLDLLATRRAKDLSSMKEQVVPWLVKGGWQRGLGERWEPILDPPSRDPLAEALARSTTAPPSRSLLHPSSSPSSDHTPLPQTSPASPSGDVDTMYSSGVLPAAPSRTRKGFKPEWKCQVLVITPPPAPPTPAPVQGKGGKQDKSRAPMYEPEHLIRANSLAGYWELNRRFIKSLSSTIPAAKGAQPVRNIIPEDAGTAPAISPAAQISPDSVLGEGTRVGEKASIKKCIIGRHCVIGKGAKLNNCVIWDFVTVEENARIENSIICSNGRIGEKAQVKDCEFGTGFEAKPGAILKGERLIAGQEA
ncbi:translation initiation factor eIF-2B subunit gamma [Cryptococcus neoformans]|nr:translation initiation factor eIF-2B subunit gamma [Cryptococcus neoformans var. grubii]